MGGAWLTSRYLSVRSEGLLTSATCIREYNSKSFRIASCLCDLMHADFDSAVFEVLVPVIEHHRDFALNGPFPWIALLRKVTRTNMYNFYKKLYAGLAASPPCFFLYKFFSFGCVNCF